MKLYNQEYIYMSSKRSFEVYRIWLLLLFIGTTCIGQTRVNSSGTGGLNTIQGQIFTANGRVIDSPITIKLQSISYGELSLITDQSGGFAFKNLSAGTYEIRVDAGEDFEIDREYITIDPDLRLPAGIPQQPIPKTFTVPVYLQPKRAAPQKNGVIDANAVTLPKEALKHFEKGVALAQSANPTDAIGELSQAVQIAPAFVPAHIELGKVYLKSGRLDLAVDSFTSALRYEPKSFDARINYGIALFAKGSYPEAETSLNEAAKLNATAVTPHYYLGLMYIREKKLDPAQKALETGALLKGSSNFPLLHKYLGGVYLAKNLKAQALKELETYLTLDPNAKDADRLRQTIADLKAQPD
jgi:tetratricopeptide (TPR) repeat protein